MSWYLMEPIGYNDDFKEAVRNVNIVKLSKGWFSRETAVLVH